MQHATLLYKTRLSVRPSVYQSVCLSFMRQY